MLTEADHSFLRRCRMALVADATVHRELGASPAAWARRAIGDRAGRAVGPKAIAAVAAWVWGRLWR